MTDLPDPIPADPPAPLPQVAIDLQTMPDRRDPPGFGVIESPFKGNERRNEAYAALMTLALRGRGYACYGSHLHCTNFLDDSNPNERRLGIDIGLDIASNADVVFMCIDNGVSNGMEKAYRAHRAAGKLVFTVRAYRLHNGRSWRSTYRELIDKINNDADNAAGVLTILRQLARKLLISYIATGDETPWETTDLSDSSARKGPVKGLPAE